MNATERFKMLFLVAIERNCVLEAALEEVTEKLKVAESSKSQSEENNE